MSAEQNTMEKEFSCPSDIHQGPFQCISKIYAFCSSWNLDAFIVAKTEGVHICDESCQCWRMEKCNDPLT